MYEVIEMGKIFKGRIQIYAQGECLFKYMCFIFHL